jgi:Tol biopolymer transport system component
MFKGRSYRIKPGSREPTQYHFKMKRALLICFFPTLLAAQDMQLTEQLGKTVIYGDIALSPDGKSVAWVQSTAATTTKQTYIRAASKDTSPTLVNVGAAGHERSDADPAWSPDSKTLAFFSNGGGGEQKQLWMVGADASGAKKLTNLTGYAARPSWSHDGKQIAFLYIESSGGGGPLLAAAPTTGIIDTAIHNQRIAVFDVASGEFRPVSPSNLHIYDFDWSPDGKTFVATGAPGPGDNNWWIAQIYKIDIAKGSAIPIYKPKLQVAVPRWSPDGKSIAFIEGLMSDEGISWRRSFYGRSRWKRLGKSHARSQNVG